MRLYAGVLIKSNKTIKYLISADNPDDVCHQLSQWPSFIKFDVLVVNITIRIYDYWKSEDIEHIISGRTVGIWQYLKMNIP